MNRIHLILLWHMHQPQYRDPSTGRYMLPWTRLHALKDYWGMVSVLEQFPRVHATFNMVPSLVAQIEEYASGVFDEPWFDLVFCPADDLSAEDEEELLAHGFQVNHEILMRRWPRYVELFDRSRAKRGDLSAATFQSRDWRDLQVLSQLAWMDEEWLASDPVVSQLSQKGSDFTEQDKELLRAKQLELLGRVLPEYRRAAERGQIEISTTPFYHPILPLLCDTDIACTANPATPLPQPAFRHPEDAREQLQRARRYHQKIFGQPPVGLWPSEGSVSDQALVIAAELGFRWFATDEGVLGRTLGVGFGRDAVGVPDNAGRLYSPLRVRLGQREIVGVFRDHYLSDLIGFVYSRMEAEAAAEDLHRRIRAISERVQIGRSLTVSIILDGENAWEYYPGNGREFLRQFYRRIEGDPDNITKLLGPAKWTYFYLYVILDVFSRYVTGWMVAMRESAELAKRLIEESCKKQQIQPGQLTLHADRGTSMSSKPVAFLLADLGVTKTHSRPHVSDDNPYSESQFRTLKYRPEFPDRFGCIQDSRAFSQGFFRWYNEEHRHSGLALLTPAMVHYGQSALILEQRQTVLDAAYRAHPERFVRQAPRPAAVPTEVWINKPPNLENKTQ